MREGDVHDFRILSPSSAAHLGWRRRKDLGRLGYRADRAERRHDMFGFAAPPGKPVNSRWFVANCGAHARLGNFHRVEELVGLRLQTQAGRLELALSLR